MMRLVTWNCCRGAYEKKAPLLDALSPDVAVLQECARPAVQNDQCVWFGNNPLQGIAIRAYGEYRLRRIRMRLDIPKYVVPVEVSGPARFLLLAVWAKPDAQYPYVEGVIRAVSLYRRRMTRQETVLLGDLNSNAIWDAEHGLDYCHSALVKILEKLGMVSSYHSFFGEAHGAEAQPTYYFQWKKEKPFHLDYCFVPRAWPLTRVEVDSYEAWTGISDHRPLVVDVSCAPRDP